jgi:hypothetical protein
MVQESNTTWSLSINTGARPCPENAIAFFSVNRHGIVSNGRPLCMSASLMRQQ